MIRTGVDFVGNQKRIPKDAARRQYQTMRSILKRLRTQPGVILADEVGMGKTYIALGVISEYLGRHPRSRALVITPSSDLAEKWTQDMKRFRRENVSGRASRLLSGREDLHDWRLARLLSTKIQSRVWILPASIFLHPHTREERGDLNELAYHLISRAAYLDINDRKTIWRTIAGSYKRLPRRRRRLRWFNYSIGSLRRTVIEILDKHGHWPFEARRVSRNSIKKIKDDIRWALMRKYLRRFSMIVVDEAHHYKNPDSKRYLAMQSVFKKRFQDMLFLTATPFQLGPDELRHMMGLFELSTERGAATVHAEAERVTETAKNYQRLLRGFEDAWKRMSPDRKKDVADGNGRTSMGSGEFDRAYKYLLAGHKDLQHVLSRWVIRNVQDRKYRDTTEGGVEIGPEDRAPFAVLHRLLCEFRRRRPTFTAVQSLSLTSSWDAFRKSNVMRSRIDGAPSVRFYRRVMRGLLARRGGAKQHPKLREVVDRTKEAFIQNEKVLVFTARVETVRALQREIERSIEEEIYRRIPGLDRQEVDRRLSQLRNRTTRRRDPLWLLFKENYFTEGIKNPPSVDDLYPEVIRQMARFGTMYRIGQKGSAKGPEWADLTNLCEWITANKIRKSSGGANVPINLKYWLDFFPHPIWLNKKKTPKKLTPEREAQILRSHYCTSQQLRHWIHQVLSHPSVWDPYMGILQKLDDWKLREDLLDAVARVLFVPEIMGRAAIAVGRRGRGVSERAVLEALGTEHVREKISNFLNEVLSLPNDEIRNYIRGLRTEGTVARASGKESSADRLRHRYGFNTPFRPYVLVATEVMQEGLDLHKECSRVVHYDLAWNPARLEQRVGRIDRLGSKIERELLSGQDAKLRIFRRYVPGTIDERMFLRVKDRERWFKIILGHRPDWEEDAPDDGVDQIPLPEEYSKQLQIILSPGKNKF